MNRGVALSAVAFSILALSSCATPRVSGHTAQRCVDDLLAIIEPHQSLIGLWTSGKCRPEDKEDLTRLVRREFNVSALLSAFHRLSLQSGRTLDYVYYMGNGGGWPVLYSRAHTADPFESYQSLTNALPHAEAKGWLANSWPPSYRFYVDDVRTDGSADGFFQLVVLYLMGDQFLHLWHDGYHDERIVCSREGLNALFLDLDKESHAARMSDHARGAARELELSPAVHFEPETASVSVVIFTKWGGFQRRAYRISRTPPHVILEERRTELIGYHCGSVM